MRLFKKEKRNNTPLEALADLRSWLLASSEALLRRKNAYELKLRAEQRLVRRLERELDIIQDDGVRKELCKISLSNHERLLDEYLERYKAISLKLAKIQSSIALADLIKEDMKTKDIAEKINYPEKLLEIKNKIGERGFGEPIDDIYETLNDIAEDMKERIPGDTIEIEEILGEKREEEEERKNVDVC